MNNNPFSLKGKRILVTGASSGIGRSIAIECSKAGAKLVVAGRNEHRLNETFLMLDGCDHTKLLFNLEDVDVFSEIADSLPALDGLVNCAGIIKTSLFQFLSKEDFTEVMNVNFTSPVIFTQMMLKKKRLVKGCSIVFISSISGVYCSGVGSSIYSASKGALNGLVKGLALDLAPKQIRVNCVNPGMIETDIFSSGVITEEQLKEDAKRYPLKRYGKPEEVAYSAIYLLSDSTKWMTGANIVIDGGYTLL